MIKKILQIHYDKILHLITLWSFNRRLLPIKNVLLRISNHFSSIDSTYLKRKLILHIFIISDTQIIWKPQSGQCHNSINMHSLIPQLVATLGGKQGKQISRPRLIITAATFGAFALGNVIAWPSSVLEKINLSDSTESWIVSIFMIGAALVPWVACNPNIH